MPCRSDPGSPIHRLGIAVGTATGDLTAHTLHLGFFTSGLVFAALIAVPAAGYRWFRPNPGV